MATIEDNHEVIWISIPLDGKTAARLMNLSDACHAKPEAVAASLLHDIMKDDEAANLPPAMVAGQITLN